MSEDAIAAMQRQGLAIVPVDPAPWHAAMSKGHALLRGGVVPAAFYDDLARAREACRTTPSAARTR